MDKSGGLIMPQPSINKLKQTEMERVIEMLSAEVEGLQTVVGALSARLGPVLNANVPSEVRPDKAGMDSLHADKINNYVYAIGDQIHILNDLLNRLEV